MIVTPRPLCQMNVVYYSALMSVACSKSGKAAGSTAG